MARRRDRQRREARRARELHEVHAPDPERFDHEKAISHWQQKLATMIGRGFAAPPFSGLVLGLEAPSSKLATMTARGFAGRPAQS